MLFLCCKMSNNLLNTWIFGISMIIIGADVVALPSYAEAFERRCSLVDPLVEQENDNASFLINLSCGASVPSAVPLAIGKAYLVGLTVYNLEKRSSNSDARKSDEDVEKALRNHGTGRSKFSLNGVNYAVEQKPLPANAPSRRVISDEIYSDTVHITKPFDFRVQLAQVRQDTIALEFKFTVNKELIAEHNYLLFALWPASQKKPCDEKDEERRSGCSSYGYVMGDIGGGDPVDFYSGRATISVGNRDEVPRWVVEGFR